MSPDRHERIEGELIIGALRERIPEVLEPIWRNSLLILLGLGGLIFYIAAPQDSIEFARAFGIVCTLYMVVLMVGVVRESLRFAQRTRGAAPLGRTLVLHTLWLSAAVFIYAVALTVANISAFGQPPPGIHWVPWVLDVGHVAAIMGLNFVWRYELVRAATYSARNQRRRERSS